jgi:uncharacterized phage-like protein YoqJ
MTVLSEKYLFKRYTSIAISGHRFLPKDFDKSLVEKKLRLLIEKNFDVFLVGMAIGFDTVCFQILEKLREEYKNISIIACVPCRDQDALFNKAQKKEYKRMLENADEVVYISEKYTDKCMHERNKFMVDNSSALFYYLNTNYGGTAKTVKYALLKGRPILEVRENEK